MRKVDFLGIGVQKAGTTTLYELLRLYPSIQMASPKEVHFFDDDRLDWSDPDYERFHASFEPRQGDRIRGEFTPRYIFHEPSMLRIKAYNPNVKLIAIFRDPVERAYSHWKMLRVRRGEPLSFGDAIRTREDPEITNVDGKRVIPRTYFQRGLYGAQARRLLELFPRENLLFLDFVELVTDRDALLRKVSHFLGIPDFPVVTSHIKAAASGDDEIDPLSAEDRSYLWDAYGRDLHEFQTLTGIDINNWPTARAFEGLGAKPQTSPSKISSSVPIDRNHLFICGTSRSGTSTFADLLRSHSKMAMGRERFAFLLGDRRQTFDASLFDKNRFCRDLRPGDTHHDRLDAYYAALEDRYDDCTHVGDKVPNLNENYSAVINAFPNSRFFFMLRNIFDVAASFQKRWEAKMRDPARQKWGAERDAIRAVHEWNRSMEQTLPLLSTGRFMIVEYERLYQDDRLLDQIFAFAGLAVEPAVRDFWAANQQKKTKLESERTTTLTTDQKLAIMNDARFDLYRELASIARKHN